MNLTKEQIAQARYFDNFLKQYLDALCDMALAHIAACEQKPSAWQSRHSGIPISTTHLKYQADIWIKDGGCTVVPLIARPVTEQYTGFDRTASHNAGEYREFQQPPDAERLADELELFLYGLWTFVGDDTESSLLIKSSKQGAFFREIITALRAKDKP